MPVQPFGKADPYYDALRVMSNQNIQAAALGDTGGAGGILENKIYLWPADGSTISTYDPDEAGLNAALAAAAVGDSVWLPSIPIAVTAAITVPTSVVLMGIDQKSTLNFSGFNGTAITLLPGSILYNFTLNYTSNGAQATGFDASASDTIVDHLIVNVNGGSGGNTGGASDTTPQALEAWILQFSNVIWCGNMSFDGTMSASWNKLAAYPNPVIVGQYLLQFAILRDGSKLFVVQADPGNGGNPTIYECTNLAAVRAAPATIPTWSAILAVGDTVTTTGGPCTVLSDMRIKRDGANLICAWKGGGRTETYGVYTGSWTFYSAQNSRDLIRFGSGALFVQSFAGPADQDFQLEDALTSSVLGSTYVHTNSRGISDAWRSTLNADFYAVRRYSTTAPYGESPGSFVYKANTIADPTANIQSLPNTSANDCEVCIIRGAIDGIHLTFVEPISGDLYLSDDRLSMTNVATWIDGIVEEVKTTGGGALIWLPFFALNSSNMLRASNDRGATWIDITGDYWTSIIPGVDDFVSLNIDLVYST